MHFYVFLQFFGASILGLPVWDPDSNFLRGPAGAPKMGLPATLPATILGAMVEMS
jgi:hypothetical protein